MPDAKAVAGGGYHYLALRGDSTVVAWGDADGADGSAKVPTTLGKTIGIAAGAHYSAAIKRDGTVVTWGGEGHAGAIPSGLGDVVQIACGRGFMLALKKDGTVVAWATNSTASQTKVPAGLKAKAVGASHGCAMAIRTDGTLAVWGENPAGQSPPSGLTNLVAVSGGMNHCVALRADGSVVAWGENTSNQCDVPNTITGVLVGPLKRADLTIADVNRSLPGLTKIFDLTGRRFHGARPADVVAVGAVVRQLSVLRLPGLFAEGCEGK
jgi:alpha-tubulin suppressor-like RCC1 family protein